MIRDTFAWAAMMFACACGSGARDSGGSGSSEPKQVGKVWEDAPLDYTFFDTYPMMGGYFFSSAESTSPGWVGNLGGKLPVRAAPAFTPGSALELTYASRKGGSWKAEVLKRPIRGQDTWDNGVFLQPTPTPYKKPEVLQLRLDAGDTPVRSLPKVSLLLRDDKMTAAVAMGGFVGKPDAQGWSRVRIPISELGTSITVAEQVMGVVFEPSEADEQEHTVFLDDVDVRPAQDLALTAGLKPSLAPAKGYERHIDLAWTPIKDHSVQGAIIERSTDGIRFVPVGYRPRWMSRFADYVGPGPAAYHYRVQFLGYDGRRSPFSQTRKAQTRPLSDDELLSMVQEASVRYYWDGAEEHSGMALESIPGDRHMIAMGCSSGFGIMALLVAVDRGFIPRSDVAERMRKILDFLERADRFHGAFPHYMDGATGHVKLFFGPDDNGSDLPETSYLMLGLLTARQFFNGTDAREKNIRERITKLWEAVEFDWHRTADPNYLLWHWSPDKEWKIHHRLIGWNETMNTYLLAIASPTHGIPPEMYYTGWASQEQLAQEYRGNAAGKMYTNGETFYGKKLDVGGFTGSPLFMIQYNFMGIDPHGLRDRFTDYFENSKTIAEINLRYSSANPQHHAGYGEEGWGLTAADGPWAYNPDEPRAEGDKGKLAPTGAVASMPFLPGPAMAALKNYYRNHGHFLWGEYGFRDAFSLDDHWVNDLYMGLNQAPMVVMIENHRTGRPWKLFGSNPEIQEMRRKVFEPKR